MNDLVGRLRIKAGVMEMGERIEWGSNIELIALMREAADRLAELIDFREKAFEAHQVLIEILSYLTHNISTQGRLSYFKQF